jgi:hypothetical protein
LIKNLLQNISRTRLALLLWALALSYVLAVGVLAVGALAGPAAIAAQAADPSTDAKQSVGGKNTAGPAQSAPANGRTAGSTNEAEINATVEPPHEDGPAKQAKGTLTIRLSVPLMKKRTDIFSLNPYSTAPPKVAIPIAPLPEAPAALRYKIINSGYNARLSMTKPYPDGGWRWHYAYDRARKISGIGEPHVFFQMYNFADDLTPYVVPQCKRINKIEAQRIKTYFALKESFADNHKDEEMEALRLGLEPIKLNFTPVRRGDVLETSLFVSPGDWWITGSHKVPGLIYFWQEPVKIREGDTVVKELNEDNAILVQGGW